MFEDAQILAKPDTAKRLVSMVISLVVHVLLVITVIIIPLLVFNKLPEGELLTFLIAPPPPPAAPPAPAPPPTNVKPITRAAVIDPNEFRAPTSMPDKLPPPMEDSPNIGVTNIVGGIPGGVQGGVIGGVPGGVVGSLISNISSGGAPPPPKPSRREALRVGGNVQESRLIRKIEPVYPELARRARVEGVVILSVNVDEEGNVTEVTVIRSNPLLKDAAVNAVKQWKYSPTTLNGEPVPVIATVTVNFKFAK
jgi:periplasmic protein TonB